MATSGSRFPGSYTRTPSWSITSVTAEAKHIAKMGDPTEPAAVDDATRLVGQDTASHRADAGMAWGTLIHGLLEHAMRYKDASREDLRSEASGTRAAILTEDELADAVEAAPAGTMVAIYRIAYEGWTKKQATDEMVNGCFGYHPIWQNLLRYIDGLDVDSIKAQVARQGPWQ